MASQRITATIRDALAKAALDRRFEAENERIEEWQGEVDRLEKEAGDLAYKNAFEPADFKMLQKIKPDWLPKCSKIKVQINGDRVTELKFHEARPVPKKFNEFQPPISRVIEPDNEALVAEAFYQNEKTKLSDYIDEINQLKADLRARVIAVVESVTTTGKLRTVWPEVAGLLSAASQPATYMLPAINMDDLNKELGL